MDTHALRFALTHEIQQLDSCKSRLANEVRANHAAHMVLESDNITLQHWIAMRRASAHMPLVVLSEYRKLSNDISSLVESIELQRGRVSARSINIGKLNTELKARTSVVQDLENKLKHAREGAVIYQWRPKLT